ncbi:predicted adenosylcobinamide amidohydrolase [Desulfobacula toluolica Tol2]|uniref:Predicted adenosylcobinamide amidohydrolase n=2 Tax=Desulfobacula toluolica TaxID=28223 RepID=K0NQD1_DESTT|nr:predicted adenosylcobinamide amidohydrolase [Desulfobacula toluolica Tol2]
MHLKTYDDVLELYRNQKKIYAKFLTPHRVISTCRVNGGLRDDISVLLNHQSCEPCNHMGAHTKKITQEPEAYLEQICTREGLDWRYCACLGTAANMNYAAIYKEQFQNLWVMAVATGGVEANAGRAGDDAHYYEKDGAWVHVDDIGKTPTPGTINIMIFINKPLNCGSMARAIVTATEAKTAVLQELAVNSRYSDGLATGTGTDQIAVAARLTDEPELTSAGKHTKLGELIGKAVKKAVRKTLCLQNRLSPEGQRSVKIHIERFGTDKKEMIQGICSHLNDDLARLAKDNIDSINRDPLIVAAVAALVHLRDKSAWGILPATCMKEIFSSFGAQVAMAVSGRTDQIETYRLKLSQNLSNTSDKAMLALIFKALAMGFEEKWKIT